ncbi:MAG: hypothetical protein HKN72_07210 [Gemmatimonadetes bacterium]|nr:hypothetical protein [Gemmatimonadota bacterium]NNF12992.1 hypothetical protein [Gemmatimonadota bacterium]
MTRRILALTATLVAAACSGFTPDPQAPDAQPFTDVGPPTSITLLVQNRNFSDARLFVLRRGATLPLGVVGGKDESEFDVDWDISDPIRIRIEILAGPSCTTEELLADPGDVLELQIDQNFMHSRQCR